MSFTNVTITGTFKDASGKLLNGVVEAIPSTAMENANVTVPPKAIKARIANGVLSFKLVANADPQTIPAHAYYTFRINPAGGPKEEFKAVVPAQETIDIGELRANSAINGVIPNVRPTLDANTASSQQIVEALGFLGVVTVTYTPPDPGVIR